MESADKFSTYADAYTDCNSHLAVFPNTMPRDEAKRFPQLIPHSSATTGYLLYFHDPFLLTWFNFNPGMDK